MTTEIPPDDVRTDTAEMRTSAQGRTAAAGARPATRPTTERIGTERAPAPARAVFGLMSEAMAARRVFADPIERGELVVIPAAKVRGGGGGGGGEEGGAGFGLSAKPAGAYVIRGTEVTWKPAIDVNRIVIGSQIVAIFALLALRGVVRALARR